MKFLLNRLAIFATSALSHLVLLWLGTSNTVGTPMGDIVYAYEPWARDMWLQGSLLGITQDWVYPYVDLVPTLLPRYISWLTHWPYFNIWVLGSVLVDFLALWALVGRRSGTSRNRMLAGYAWIGLQFLLGPVAISRLDNISIAIAIFAVAALLNHRRAIAAGWLSIGIWVKIWPVALLSALFASSPRLRPLLVSSGVVLFGILAVGWFWGGTHSISFLSEQADRGIQIEAPVAAFWLWALVFGDPNSALFFSDTYLTFQVAGPGTIEVAHWISFVFAGAVLITAWLSYRAWRALQSSFQNKSGSPDQVFAWASLTMILDLIVFNKVGSPQYIGWIFVPVVFAAAKGLKGWFNIGIAVAVVSALTFLVYPITYDAILKSAAWPTAILTLRNLILILLLVQANIELMRLGDRTVNLKPATA